MAALTPGELDLRATCAPSPDVLSAEIEGDTVLVPIVRGVADAARDLYVLNGVGQAIWKRMDGRHTLKDLSEQLGEEFEAPPEELGASVLEFAAELMRRGFLVTKSAA